MTAGLSDSGENLRSKKKPKRRTEFFYSDYSVKHRLEAICVFSVVSVVRMHRNGRVSSLFSNERRFPKLDVAGSIPVSRSINSMTWEDFIVSGLVRLVR
jgi:hypothetical protein